MISINYRTKIIDTLEGYDVDCIQGALPNYYPTIRPRLQEISELIATLRTEKRFNSFSEETAVDELSSFAMVAGIVMGIVGMVLIALAYPLYNRVLKKQRERIAPEILRLTDE